jgi:outer membrane protein assembly factor BamB
MGEDDRQRRRPIESGAPPESTERRTGVADSELGQAPPAAPPAPSRSDAALAAYRSRMRRARVVYFAAVAVVVVALGVVGAVAYSRGEAAHASLHTFAPPPSALPLSPPAAPPHLAWRTTDRLAIGAPQINGTVVTWSAHTVGGRDARTGARTWSYTRTDRTLCTAAQSTNTTVAVYELHGNCDQVSAFDSDTGRRRWTRTLDKDGRPIDGTPRFQMLSYTFLISSGTTIYAIDPVTGYDRWTYYRYGCHLDGAVLGSAGALISQTCSSAVRCGGVKYCAGGPQLLLRDGSAGNADDGDNKDRITWLRRGALGTPVSADDVLAVLAPDRRTLQLLAAKNGAAQQAIDLGAAGGTGTTATAVGSTELVWRSGTTYAIDATGSRPAWTARTGAPPTAVSSGGAVPTGLAGSRITAAQGGDVVALDPDSGRVSARYAVAAPDGAIAYPMGSGFLVGSTAGAAFYR